MIWKDYFIYDETSPSCLRNTTDKPPKRKKGEVTGYCRKDGYWLCGNNGKNVLIHRIIYEMFYGKIPDNMQVDHIDGNPSNNRITNLRLVDSVENQRNMKRQSRNKSGFTGVSFTRIIGKKGNVNEYWVSHWKENNKQHSKHFPVSKFGYHHAYELAIDFRENKIKELNKLGYNYTERHGHDN